MQTSAPTVSSRHPLSTEQPLQEPHVRFGFQRFARRVLKALFRALLRLTVVGIENVPRQGRLIVIMNHLSFLDPILVSALMPRDIAIMSKIENFQIPVLGKVVEWYGSFPVRRGELDMAAIRTSVQVLEGELALLLAPEGTRSKTGGLQTAFDGMAMIATRAHTPVLPVAMTGNESFPSQLKRLRRTQVTVRIGEPFVFQSQGTAKRREELARMTQEAMVRLAALLPESYRGEYAGYETDSMTFALSVPWHGPRPTDVQHSVREPKGL